MRTSFVAEFGYRRFGRKRNFIQAVVSVDHEGSFYSQFAQGAGQQLDVAFIEHSCNLRGSAGGIGQRAKKIKGCADF